MHVLDGSGRAAGVEALVCRNVVRGAMSCCCSLRKHTDRTTTVLALSLIARLPALLPALAGEFEAMMLS